MKKNVNGMLKYSYKIQKGSMKNASKEDKV